MDKHLEAIQRDWNDLAEIDPLWAIASSERKSHGRWDLEEFFDSGRQRVSHVLAAVQATGRTMNKGKVLDFGCGVGRMTQALAAEFPECYGFDISPRMVELANQFNRFGDRCRYAASPSGDLSIFANDFFDVIFTVEVLQHLPEELAKRYLVDFVRVLAPGGLLTFEVPVERITHDHWTPYLRSLPRHHPRRIINKLKSMFLSSDGATQYYRLRRLGLPRKWLYEHFEFRPNIPMYCLETNEIVALVRNLGADIVVADSHVYEGLRVSLFVAEKASQPPR